MLGIIIISPCQFWCFYFNFSAFSIFREVDDQWVEEDKLEVHSDWVRDVAWAPNVGLPVSTIASCSQVMH